MTYNDISCPALAAIFIFLHQIPSHQFILSIQIFDKKYNKRNQTILTYLLGIIIITTVYYSYFFYFIQNKISSSN